MKYVIYKIETSTLSTIERDGYYYKEVGRNVLVEIDFPLMASRHDSFEDAVAEINKFKSRLRGDNLTILPHFHFGWCDDN